MADAITLYVRSGDMACDQARRFLDERKIAYTARDVISDPAASAALVGRLGKVQVPAFLIGERMIVGFDPMQLLRYLPKTDSEDEHVTFGAAVRTLSADVARERGLAAPFGVEVGPLKAGSPAAAAGIQSGDIITAIGSYTLTGGAEQFRIAVGARKPGDTMKLTVWRGRDHVIDVQFPVPTEA